MSEELDDDVLDRLRTMTEQHVVAVRSANHFRGTGFLVSKDTVLTCAHVVTGHEGKPLSVDVQGRNLTAEVVHMEPRTKGEGPVHDFPDLAELRLAEPVAHLDGVWLDEHGPAQSEPVSVHGLSGHTLERGVRPDTLDMDTAGRSGRFVRLKSDQVVQGLSGSPVLSTRTGRICGVLKASRNEKGVFGGWLIPIDAVELCSPGLLGRNTAAHRPGTDWFDTTRGRARRQAKLFGPDRGDPGRRTTPAQMLARGAMPFMERPELGELHQWCRDPADHLLRLMCAPGGSGKTRLAAELCRRVRDDGWIAGFADRDVSKDAYRFARWLDDLVAALAAGLPVLVVFDYAQARLDDICALLEQVHRHDPAGMTLRVLLLARSEEPLWPALREALEDRDIEDRALEGASVHTLPSTLDRDPEDLAAEAFKTFAAHLDCPWLSAPDELGARARRQDSLLGALASALDAVLTLKQGGTWAEADDPLVRICRHEINGWQAQLEDRLGRDGPLAGSTGKSAAQGLLLVPTLAPARAQEELTSLLGRVRAAAFPGQPPLNTYAVHACLRALYPSPPDRVAVLEPDRIGEILVRRVLSDPESSGQRGGRDYLAAVLDVGAHAGADGRPDALVEAFDVLARARGCTAVGRVAHHRAHERLDAALAEVVRVNQHRLLPALVTVACRVPHAEPLAEVMRPVLESCDTALLELVEERLPGYHSSLSPVSALVLRRLLDLPDEGAGEKARPIRLRRLVRYSLRLGETGHSAEAVEAADQAVALSRELVRDSERHTPDHAAALNNLSVIKHRVGDTTAALGHSVEAVDLYRRLLREATGAQRPRRLLDTASALSTLALLRLTDGQVNGAAEDAAEAVVWCAEAATGARQEDVLLPCLEILAECRHRIGLTEEALTSGAEAVDLLRDLAERRPGRYLARLPDTLQRYGLGLIRAGRDREAYLALREAARLRAALPLRTAAGVRDQRVALGVLARLSGEFDELAGERSSWLRELAATDGRDDQ